MVLYYVVVERVARFPRRLGCGYPQDVTKPAEEEGIPPSLALFVPFRG